MSQSSIKSKFLDALHAMKKVEVVFYSMEDNKRLVRICAPMDFGPSRRTKDKSLRYHFWDFTSDVGSHTLSLHPNQVRSIVILSESFNPAKFVNWRPNWIIKRDWGKYS